MFTGIIQDTAKIVSIVDKKECKILSTSFSKEMLKKLEIGASVSHNGCCLTIISIKNCIVSVELVQETIKLTNFKYIKIGDLINLERSACFGSEIGGHIMYGHIHNIGKISKIDRKIYSRNMWVTINDESLLKYIFYKGNIGIDGVSLTISNIENNSFCVNLIPETIKKTTLGIKVVGDFVNLEIDFQSKIIVDTIKDYLKKNHRLYLKNL